MTSCTHTTRTGAIFDPDASEFDKDIFGELCEALTHLPSHETLSTDAWETTPWDMLGLVGVSPSLDIPTDSAATMRQSSINMALAQLLDEAEEAVDAIAQ